MNMLAKNVCGLVVSFVVTSGRSWSFQTLDLEIFKTEQDIHVQCCHMLSRITLDCQKYLSKKLLRIPHHSQDDPKKGHLPGRPPWKSNLGF